MPPTSAVVRARGVSWSFHLLSAPITPHAGTLPEVMMGSADALTVVAPPWNEECDILPVCQSCATTVQPSSCSFEVTAAHAELCSAV